MALEGVPGVNAYYDFSEFFSSSNPLDMLDLFRNPRREKYGFYWEIDSSIIKQTIKYRRFSTLFSGFYIEGDEAAGVAMGIFNRVFYNQYIKNFKIWTEKENRIFQGINSTEMNKMRWGAFYSHLKENFSLYNVPFRKFLATKRPDKCWISFSESEITPQDPIYLDFLCGTPSLEFKRPGLRIESKEWRDAIKEGPMVSPDIAIVENFFVTFPGSIKYAPREISERFDMDCLITLSDFGII